MSANSPRAGAPPAAASRPRRGDELELEVTALAHGGDGIARHEGYVVFVAGGLPGDRVRAVVTDRRRSHGRARVTEVLDGGPDRVEPVADHPGVPWQTLRYERQVAEKERQVDEALRRLGGLDGFELEPAIPAVATWRYRNKLEYSFGHDPSAPSGLVCGFHAPGRWDTVVGMTDCLLASADGNRMREAVLAWARESGLEAHDRRTGRGVLRNLVVREGRNTGEFQVRLVTSPTRLDVGPLADALAPHALWWTQTADAGETTAGGVTELVAGEDRLAERVGELFLALSPHAFLQTNTEMAERLYTVAVEMAGLRGWERVYDLYCGIGTIALTLAPRAGEVWGLEVVGDAVADATANAMRNEIDNARFFAGDARTALGELVERAGRPDVLVLDPPRSGLSSKVVRRVIETGARRIVYVSCNPTTLAPNAAQLVEAGWSLRRVRTVDMFPQTPHVECVAVLDRGPA